MIYEIYMFLFMKKDVIILYIYRYNLGRESDLCKVILDLTYVFIKRTLPFFGTFLHIVT